MKKIILLILAITLLSCRYEKENKEKEFIDSPIDTDITTTVIDSIKYRKNSKKATLDTIDVANFNVLFFKPNELEYRELWNKDEENSGLNEVDSDFRYYLNKVFDSISAMGYKVKTVDERIIKISFDYGIKYIDRLENENGYYGIILNHSKCEPKIYYGVMTDIGFFQELKDYFKNCK